MILAIIKRENATKFLGILIDENLTWKPHIQYIETKISKNIGLLYKAKLLLNQKSLKSIYFSFIHSYTNNAWASTHQTKLKKLFKFQKHASRILYNEDRTTHARPLMKSLNALNVYQIYILQNIILTYKSQNNLCPTIFKERFKPIEHKYQTRQSSQNLYLPKTSSKPSDFRVSYRGPYIWNNFLSEESKLSLSVHALKTCVKKQLLNNSNELNYY